MWNHSTRVLVSHLILIQPLLLVIKKHRNWYLSPCTYTQQHSSNFFLRHDESGYSYTLNINKTCLQSSVVFICTSSLISSGVSTPQEQQSGNLNCLWPEQRAAPAESASHGCAARTCKPHLEPLLPHAVRMADSELDITPTIPRFSIPINTATKTEPMLQPSTCLTCISIILTQWIVIVRKRLQLGASVTIQYFSNDANDLEADNRQRTSLNSSGSQWCCGGRARQRCQTEGCCRSWRPS